MLLKLSLLFFASGACALVYQVMRLRMLALVFGVTVYAASTVLASFMAGLALGAWALATPPPESDARSSPSAWSRSALASPLWCKR